MFGEQSAINVLMRISGDSKQAVQAIRSTKGEIKNLSAEQRKAFEDMKRGAANFAKALAVAVAAVTAAVWKIVDATADAGDRFDKMSLRTGETVENLSRFNYAAEITGTSMEQIEKGLLLISRRMVDADRGLETSKRTFDELGISVRDANGQLKSGSDVLLEFADWASKTNDQTRLTAYAMELFGRSGAELIPFLKEGRDGIEALMQKSDELGITLSTKTASAGAELKDRMTDLKMSLEGVRNMIGTELMPVVIDAVKGFISWVKANRELLISGIGGFLKAVVAGFTALLKTMNQLRWILGPIGAALITIFAVRKIQKFISTIQIAIGSLSKLSQTTISKIAKIGVGWTMMATAAIIAINALFDHLNAKMDERMAKNRREVEEGNKKFQDMQAVMKLVGDKEWQKARGEIFGDEKWQSQERKYDLIVKYAESHENALAEKIRVALEKQKALREKSADGEIDIEEAKDTKLEDLMKAHFQRTADLRIAALKKSAEDEKLSAEERRKAAEAAMNAELELLAHEKEEEIQAFQNAGEKRAEAEKQVAAEYALREQEIRDSHEETIRKIDDAEKKLAEEREKKAKEYGDTVAGLDREILQGRLAALESELNAENVSKEKKLQIAQEIFDLKMALLEMELKQELANAKATGNLTDALEQRILEIHRQRQEAVRTEYGQTATEIGNRMNETAFAIMDFANRVSDTIMGIGGAISKVVGMLGGPGSEMESAVRGMVSAFQSGASAVASFISGDIIGGVTSAISAVGDLVGVIGDLFGGESFEESFNRQFQAWGFNDQYSAELLKKIESASNRLGSKEAGITANLEDFFKETSIDTEGEFRRMSEFLSAAVSQMQAEGYSADEAFAKYGDELEQLRKSQEQYGFESTDALNAILEIQRVQTKEGRVGGISEAISGLDRVLSGMSQYDFSQESWTSIFGLMESSFQKLQKEGLSMTEIFDVLGPRVEQAMKIAEEKGVDTSAMKDLKDFYSKMAGAGGLLDIISGLGQAVSGLSSTGTLSQENLSQMAITAQETYRKLLEKGFTEQQALAQLGPVLAEMSGAAEKWGLTLPDEVAGLSEAAAAFGIGIEKSVPEKLDDLGNTFLDGLGVLGDRLVEALTKAGGNIPFYQKGGFVAESGGGSVVPVYAHEGEYIVNPEAASKIGKNTMDAINRSGLLPLSAVPVGVPMMPSTDVFEKAAGKIEKAGELMQSENTRIMADLGNKIKEMRNAVREGVALAFPQAGKTEVRTDVNLNGQAILNFIQTCLNNGSLKIKANAIKAT